MNIAWDLVKLGYSVGNIAVKCGYYRYCGVHRMIYGKPESEMDVMYRKLSAQMKNGILVCDSNHKFYWENVNTLVRGHWAVIQDGSLVGEYSTQLEALQKIVDLKSIESNQVKEYVENDVENDVESAVEVRPILMVQVRNEGTMTVIG